MPRLTVRLTTFFAVLSAAALAVLTLASVAGASADPLTNARDATAAFNDQASAQAAGYGLLTDAEGIPCIDQPGTGAMGIHYVNGALVEGGKIDPARPQALVYELDGGDRLRLVAVEYVVLQSVWDSTHSGPPSLFGHDFMLSPDGNRFGLPAFYSLHAWIWKQNPTGTFSMWNPRVSCLPFSGAESSVAIDAPEGPAADVMR